MTMGAEGNRNRPLGTPLEEASLFSVASEDGERGPSKIQRIALRDALEGSSILPGGRRQTSLGASLGIPLRRAL